MQDDPESSLRESWSIGPLRPWMLTLANRQLPAALRGRVDASDIVQQAMLEAWRGHQDFRGKTHAEKLAWLRVILTRTIIRNDRDQLKTQRRGQGRERQLQAAVVNDSLRLEQLAAGQETCPAAQADANEQSLLLAAAMKKLPAQYREVLTLRHLEGLTHVEIAKRMGRSPAAVRMLWVRALESLKKCYLNVA